ncbi:YggT family protein [bacterium]|nr:YggT family protein [bacterium]
MEQIVTFSILVEWVLRIYSWVHIAAFLLSWINADPNNQIVYWINRVTIPMWNWVRYKLPQNLSAFAPIMALLLVIFGEIVLPGIVRTVGASIINDMALDDSLFNIVRYLAYGGLYIFSSIIWFVFILSVLWFVFTLVNPPLNNPFVRAIWFLVDPLITPIQRYLPRSRIDFSPLVLAILALIFRSLVERLMIPVQSGLLI